MRGRVSTKIGIAVFTLLLVTLVVQVALTCLVMRKDVTALRERTRGVGLQLMALALAGGPHDLATVARALERGPGAGIYDARGVAISRAPNAPERLAREVLARARAVREPVSPYPGMGVLHLHSSGGEARFVALVEGAVDERLLAARTKILIAITLASVLFGLAASLWLSRQIRRKLLETRNVVRRVAEGELDVRLPVSSDDEVGQFALDFNRMAERLSEHIAALKQEDQRRRRTLADWTHEIATPLTSVIGYLEALRSGALEPVRRARYLKQAHDQAKSLERLTEDLTVLSQLESEGLQLLCEPCEITALVDAELEPSRLRVPHVRFERTGAASVRAHVDPQRFAQILRNLVGNAERHARTQVTAVCEAGEQSVWVRIQDDGNGIAPEHLAHVTESFYRVDASRDRQTGGRGLGLSIAQRLAEAHQGSLQIASKVGEGTAVTVRIPAT